MTVVYPRGPVRGLPEEHASRRERFAELDGLQPGWQVELRSRSAGGTVDAMFFSPGGVLLALIFGSSSKLQRSERLFSVWNRMDHAVVVAFAAGEAVGAYANARRAALAWSKQQPAHPA